MTAALASAVDALDLEPEPGVSTRAVRTVLRMMAKIVRDDGNFRYGIRGSKLAAELTDYSLSVVRRAQRYLVDHGLVERVQVGGGRASTRWRLVVDKLRPGHSTGGGETRQPAPPDTPQEPRPGLSRWMHPRRSAPRTPSVTSTTPPPWRAGRVETCDEHGGPAGPLPDGRPRCPQCRRDPRQSRPRP